jgi:LysM repeat protein
MKAGFKTFFSIIILITAASACSAAPGQGSLIPLPALTVALTPYHSSTPRPSLTPTSPATATALPSPTPTPRTHTVRLGEDLSSIAFRYGVSLDALIEANPKINPRVLIVGNVLIIPPSSKPQPTSQSAVPQVTPIPVELSQPVCYANRQGGLTCFSLASNPLQSSLENLSVVFRLVDRDSGAIQSQDAYAPLDVLAPAGAQPLMAVFPAPAPAHFDCGVELLTSLPSHSDNSRYLSAQVLDAKTTLSNDGLSAQVSGSVHLQDSDKTAVRVWVLATAFDASHQVAGYIRWQLASPLTSGQNQPFSFSVYSTGPAIVKVDLSIEARP